MTARVHLTIHNASGVTVPQCKVRIFLVHDASAARKTLVEQREIVRGVKNALKLTKKLFKKDMEEIELPMDGESVQGPLVPVVDGACSFNDYQAIIQVQHPFCTLKLCLLDEHDKVQGQASCPLTSLSDQKPIETTVSLNEEADLSIGYHFRFPEEWHVVYEAAAMVQERMIGTGSMNSDDETVWNRVCDTLSGFVSQLEDNHDDSLFYRDILALRCMALLFAQHRLASQAAIQRLVSEHPTWPQSHFVEGLLHIEREAYDDAEASFRRGLLTDPNDPDLIQAMQDLDRMVIRRRVHTYVEEGYRAFEKGNYEVGVDAFTKACGENPHNPEVHVCLATCLLYSGRVDDALKRMGRVVQVDPWWPHRAALLGGNLEKMGRLHRVLKMRYFVLRDGYLFYYNNDQSDTPNGIIPLWQATVRPDDDRSANGQWLALSTQLGSTKRPRPRRFVLRCPTVLEADEWLRILQETCDRRMCLPSTASAARMIWTPSFADKTAHKQLFQPLQSFAKALPPAKVVHKIAKTALTALSKVNMTEQVTMQGLLSKRGDIHRAWRTRWFVLQGQRLHYFVSMKHPVAKGIIRLAHARIRYPAQSVKDKYAFEVVTSTRTYVLCVLKSEEDADRAKLLRDWLSVLQRATRTHNLPDADALERPQSKPMDMPMTPTKTVGIQSSSYDVHVARDFHARPDDPPASHESQPRHRSMIFEDLDPLEDVFAADEDERAALMRRQHSEESDCGCCCIC